MKRNISISTLNSFHFITLTSIITIILVEAIKSQKDTINKIAIDIGNDIIKASFYENGKFISMIENFQSNTKTASAISFKGEERYYGSDAVSKYSKNPESVFIRLNKFLGLDVSKFSLKNCNNNLNINNNNENNLNINNQKDYQTEIIQNELIESLMKLAFLKEHNILYNLKIDKERNSLVFNLKTAFAQSSESNSNLNFSIEEIYAMIFRYIKSFSNKFLAKEINDFTIAIPSHFSYKQRTALIQSLAIANIKVSSLITSGLSAGIYLALEKSFVNKDKSFVSYNIVFDMGSAYTQVGLFAYNSHLKVESKKSVEVTNFKKIYETWDISIGGSHFDLKIAEILASKYKEAFKHKKNFIYKSSENLNKISNVNSINDENLKEYESNPDEDFINMNKININLNSLNSEINDINDNNNANYILHYQNENILISKFLIHATKIKEILSANKEHKFNFIIDNENFTGNITRKEFEQQASDLFELAAQPIKRLLETTNKHISEIESIQIIGGGSRIPKIREILNLNFGSKKVLNNLNGDDAVALGAAYLQANKTLGGLVYKGKRVVAEGGVFYPFNGDLKIRVKNLLENEKVFGRSNSYNDFENNKNREENSNESESDSENKGKKIAEVFCQQTQNDKNTATEEAESTKQRDASNDNNFNECLEKVDEERTIFAKDLNREGTKKLQFQNKINSNLIIEVYESFKENKHQNHNSLFSLIKNSNLNTELKALITKQIHSLDFLGSYKINNIENYLRSIRSEIAENSGLDGSQNNYAQNVPITLNLIVSADSLGSLSFKGEFQYEALFYLNYEKTKKGEFKFFYAAKCQEKLDNKTLSEEFNYINTSQNFKGYSKTDKNTIKKKLKFEIGIVKKSEMKKREILLEFIPAYFPLPLSKKQLVKAKVKLNSLDAQDEQKRKIGEKLNNLENLIYTKLDFLNNLEFRKFFIDKTEEKKVNVILNQIKEEVFESNSDINPFYTIMNTKQNKNNDLNYNKNNKNLISGFANMLNNKQAQNEDYNLQGIEEKVKIINKLFEDIDKSFEINVKRNAALEEFQSLFDSVSNENAKSKAFFEKEESKSTEYIVDLNNKRVAYEKEIGKLYENFNKSVMQKLSEFEIVLAKKIEEQSQFSLREKPLLTEDFIKRGVIRIQKSFDKFLSEKKEIESKYKNNASKSKKQQRQQRK